MEQNRRDAVASTRSRNHRDPQIDPVRFPERSNPIDLGPADGISEPRACRVCGVRKARLPWSREGSGSLLAGEDGSTTACAMHFFVLTWPVES